MKKRTTERSAQAALLSLTDGVILARKKAKVIVSEKRARVFVGSLEALARAVQDVTGCSVKVVEPDGELRGYPYVNIENEDRKFDRFILRAVGSPIPVGFEEMKKLFVRAAHPEKKA